MKFVIELPEEEIPSCPCDPERISQVLGILLGAMPSVMSPQTGKLFFPFHRPKRTFLSASKTTDPVFRILPRLLFSGVFTGQILPRRWRGRHFGLGLCIAYEIISLHKGTISVLDTPGGGSTFRFLCRWHNTVKVSVT